MNLDLSLQRMGRGNPGHHESDGTDPSSRRMFALIRARLIQKQNRNPLALFSGHTPVETETIYPEKEDQNAELESRASTYIHKLMTRLDIIPFMASSNHAYFAMTPFQDRTQCRKLHDSSPRRSHPPRTNATRE
jgi:hypothetical protein